MKKVKSQWVAVAKTGVAIAALATVAIGGNLLVEATEDKDTVKTEQSLAAETDKGLNDTPKKEKGTSAYNWVANTVSQVASEIEVQREAGKSIYEIITGDTLWALSQATGISVDELAKLNGIENYQGTQRQNDQLLELLKQGRLRA